MLALALGLVVATGCAGKKRSFGPALDLGEEAQEGSSGETGAPVQASAGTGEMANSESQPLPTLAAPVDGGASASSTSAAVEPCGDACSGECEPGDTQCTSPTERIECGIDALWSEPVACPSVCIDGSCTGECSPASTECVTTTRFRECSELGVWSEATDCENACIGAACGGECKPGQTRCASTTSAQLCDEQGQWGAIAACQNACVGSACTGECMPGITRCSSETQLQICNERGQFLAGAVCPAGQECQSGGCVNTPAALATSAAPTAFVTPIMLIGSTIATVRWVIINNGGSPTAPLTLTRNFNSNEFTVEGPCLGVPLNPGNTCTLNITFTPQRPAGTRNVTFTVTADSSSLSTTLPPITVRVGAGGDCTLGASGECAPGVFCQSWFLDQDLDGYGGDELSGGAPTKSTCSNQPNIGRPPDVIVTDSRGEVAMPYRPASLSGDCCDLPGLFRGSGISSTPSDVHPGITAPSSRPANACAEPFDFNCDGEAVSEFGRNPTFGTGSCTRNGSTCTGGGLVSASPTCPGTFSVATCSFVAPPGPGCVGSGNGGALSCL